MQKQPTAAEKRAAALAKQLQARGLPVVRGTYIAAPEYGPLPPRALSMREKRRRALDAGTDVGVDRKGRVR
jgi:hypothetical protein